MSGNEVIRHECEPGFSTGQYLPQRAYLEISFPEVDGRLLKIVKRDAGSGKPLASSDFRLNAKGAYFFHAASEADDTLLIWMSNPDKIFEFSSAGKHLIRTIAIPSVWFAHKQRDGNLIVAQSLGSKSRILEIDANGKAIWEAFSQHYGVVCIQQCFPLLSFGFSRPHR
jgi:hypothetical protein